MYKDVNTRALARTPFDSNVVSNFDVMETILDNIFINLGTGVDGRLDRGVLMTEPVCNPTQVRKGECYSHQTLAKALITQFSRHERASV